jgi:hypothetical protein
MKGWEYRCEGVELNLGVICGGLGLNCEFFLVFFWVFFDKSKSKNAKFWVFVVDIEYCQGNG